MFASTKGAAEVIAAALQQPTAKLHKTLIELAGHSIVCNGTTAIVIDALQQRRPRGEEPGTVGQALEIVRIRERFENASVFFAEELVLASVNIAINIALSELAEAMAIICPIASDLMRKSHGSQANAQGLLGFCIHTWLFIGCSWYFSICALYAHFHCVLKVGS